MLPVNSSIEFFLYQWGHICNAGMRIQYSNGFDKSLLTVLTKRLKRIETAAQFLVF